MVKKTYLTVIVLIIVIVFLSIIFLVSRGPVEKEEVTEELPPGVTALAQGKQTYSIRTDQPKNPQITQVDLDPLDVKVGKTQIITVKVKDTENKPITKAHEVQAVIFTDNTSATVPFKLVRADGPDLVTTWEGSWVAEDTHNYTYTATIEAKNATGQSSVDLSFR